MVGDAVKAPPVALRMLAVLAALAVTVATSAAPPRYAPDDGRDLFGSHGLIVCLQRIDTMGLSGHVTQIDAHFTIRNTRLTAVALSTAAASIEWSGRRLVNTTRAEATLTQGESRDFWIHFDLPTGLPKEEMPDEMNLTLATTGMDAITVLLRLR